MEFEGVRALVTGGASGIGAAVLAELVARGADVAVIDLQLDSTERARLSLRCDVSDDKSVRSAVAKVAAELQGLDVVVNCAGIGAVGTVESNHDDEWQRLFDVNVVGMVRVSRSTIPYLRRSDRASIVNICSAVATTGVPERALYSATKGGVHALTLAMAADYVHEDIRVNCVSPGTTDTPWVGSLLTAASSPGEERRALEARQPMGRLVAAKEVAVAVAYLASPLSGATTGVNLLVDGGLSTLRLRSSNAALREGGA